MTAVAMILSIPVAPRKKDDTLQEWTYQQLRFALLIGAFAPGVSVTMRGLAKLLDVSLMPVREALRRLVAEQALHLLPTRRVTVPAMTTARFEELCATRISLECLAAERAMLAVTADDLADMQRVDETMNAALAAGDVVESVVQNYRFHRHLYAAVRTQVLFPLIENLWLQFGPFQRAILERMGKEVRISHYVINRHTDILRALEQRDAFALRVAVEADIRDGTVALGRLGLGDTQVSASPR